MTPAKKATGGFRNRRRSDGKPKELSDTRIYVGNLPFEVTEDDLVKIFKEYAVKTAEIWRSKRSNRSTGVGFLEMESHEAQLKVLEEVKDATIENRKLVVKPAHVVVPKSDETEAKSN